MLVIENEKVNNKSNPSIQRQWFSFPAFLVHFLRLFSIPSIIATGNYLIKTHPEISIY